MAIVGAGPAGLMAAERLAAAGLAVTVFDRMPSVGRKFLLAGRGGLNLTHGEALDGFLDRYGAARGHLETAVRAFPPAALRAWCEELGVPTFEGSSGRIFPRALKTSPLLRAWLGRLRQLGVEFRLRHRWIGWEDGRLAFAAADGATTLMAADATLLALGGASWPRLGSDAAWTSLLAAEGIAVAPLAPANCGFEVAWSETFRARFAGQPLKPVVVSVEGRAVRGEAVVTDYGLEGGAIYAHAAPLRDTLARGGAATLTLDLRPGLGVDDLTARLGRPRKGQSTANFLRKTAGLSPIVQNLVREHDPHAFMGPADALAALVKALPLRVTAARGLDRAISTAGGVRFDALDENFMLRAKPGVFVAGEMLDWEAPTGGYLLQACFSTGSAASRGLLAWLRERATAPGLRQTSAAGGNDHAGTD